MAADVSNTPPPLFMAHPPATPTAVTQHPRPAPPPAPRPPSPQYLPPVGYDPKKYQFFAGLAKVETSALPAELPDDFDDDEEEERAKAEPLHIPPPVFSRWDLPRQYRFRQNPQAQITRNAAGMEGHAVTVRSVSRGGMEAIGGGVGLRGVSRRKRGCRRLQKRLGGTSGYPAPRDALEGKGPQRRPQKRLDRRLEEVAEAVGGGYCRLQMLLTLALGVRKRVAGRRLGALGGGAPPFQCIPAPSPPPIVQATPMSKQH